MASILTVSGVSFEFPNGHILFRGLHLTLPRGLSALVGPNGVGKTTLAGLLTGAIRPTAGSVRRQAPVTFLPQREDPPAQTVAEYLVSEYSWSRPGEALLEGIELDSLCPQLSGGQWMRVRLARALGDQYLILDEPTNDLDRGAREAVLRFLREREGGALVISHDREILAICGHIFELSNQGLREYGGGWEKYREERERERNNLTLALDEAERKRDAAARDQYEQRERQEKRNRRGAAQAAKGGIPAIIAGGLKRRAQATTGKIHTSTLERAEEAALAARKALGELKIDPVMYAEFMSEPLPNQKLVAEAKDFNIHRGRWLYERDLNFAWRGNLRLAIKGGNGSGKSSLIKALLGEHLETKGSLRAGGLRALYLDQRCAQLAEDQTVYENIRHASELVESEIRNALAKFLFAREAAFRPVKNLSGGERLRAALALAFLSRQKPEFLILDEPTNNLDLQNIEFLEGLVSAFRGPLLVVSHDESFLQNCGVEEALDLDAVP